MTRKCQDKLQTAATGLAGQGPGDRDRKEAQRPGRARSPAGFDRAADFG